MYFLCFCLLLSYRNSGFDTKYRNYFSGRHKKSFLTVPVLPYPCLFSCLVYVPDSQLAIFISYYYQSKTLSKKQAECLLPLASFLNPMFIMGYLRSQISLQGRAWSCYFLSLYLPVFLCYMGIQCFDRYQNNHRKKQTIQTLAKSSLSPMKRSDSKKASLSDDVWLPSIEIISIIGIYIMIFSILSGMLMRLSLFRTPICTFLLANLEITTGIHLLAVSNIYSSKAMYALSAMAASLGGLCTMAQVQTVIADTDLSLKKYAAIKIVTALSSGLLCSILI